MSRTASRDSTVRYAASQVNDCEGILAQHTATGSLCSYGRQSPCPVAASIWARRDHFRRVVALLDMTQELPQVRSQINLPIAPKRHIRRCWPSRMLRRVFWASPA